MAFKCPFLAILTIYFISLYWNLVEADTYDIIVNDTGIPCPDNDPVLFNRDTRCTIGRPSEDLSLTCKPSDDLPSNLVVAWYYNGKDYAGKDTSSFSRIYPSDLKTITNSTLSLKNLNVADSGWYNCRIENANSTGQLQNQVAVATDVIRVFVLPYVSGVRKNVTAIEENPVQLNCSVSSSVSATVVWELDTGRNGSRVIKGAVDADDRISFESSNGTVTNNVLIIKSANMTLDSGTYTCYAESILGNSTKSSVFKLKVKSKYAALWPFLGICAEVAILCIIILIYEKKRDKTELEESDTDQGPEETKRSPDNGQDGGYNS